MMQPVTTLLQWFTVTMSVTNCVQLQNSPTLIYASTSCTDHDQCSVNQACILGNCADPCESLCGGNTYCTILQHIPACACREGHTGNPFIGCTLQVISGAQSCNPPGKKTYQIVTSFKADWTEALMYCLRHNSSLVSIDNMDEFENILEAMNNIGHGFIKYWTSGSDIGSEGQFAWVSSGKQFTAESKLWRENEPNNVNDNENCVAITNYLKDNYGLIDNACTFKDHFICERYS